MPVGKMQFSWDAPGAVAGLIQKWTPPEFKSEGEYEKDLYGYLHDNLNGIEVTRQFGSSRSRVDICVGRKVFVELKKDLDSTAKLQRLLGQLQLYAKEKWEFVLLVVVGQADKNLLAQAKEGLEKIGRDSWALSDNWRLIRK
jgi:hypothetical protein